MGTLQIMIVSGLAIQLDLTNPLLSSEQAYLCLLL